MITPTGLHVGFRDYPEECSADGCRRPTIGRGYCSKHYQRVMRLGTPDLPSQGIVYYARIGIEGQPQHAITESLISRFWSHVLMGGVDECWLWQGGLRPDGYGYMVVGLRPNRRIHLVHRIAWVLTHGEIPGVLTVDHLCFNPPCVNPNHMRLLTLSENTGNRKPGARRFKRACQEGHLFTEDNIVYRNGARTVRLCRTCLSRKLNERNARLCDICSTEYVPPLDPRNRSKTCSARCLAELRRKNGQGRSTKLDAEKVRTIRAMLASGVAPKLIAERYGITRPSVTDIKLRKSWGYIE